MFLASGASPYLFFLRKYLEHIYFHIYLNQEVVYACIYKTTPGIYKKGATRSTGEYSNRLRMNIAL